jgi:replication factor C small subunit
MKKQKEHSLWIEKYRPKTIENYIGNDNVKKQISEYIKKNDIPHLLFSGVAGVGKTTLAKIIINSIKCDYIYLNASDENGIDVIREKVKEFASTASFQPIKIIILDEADFLTTPAQSALRSLTEEYSLNTRFIFTCNYLSKIIQPLQSRFELYNITPPSMGDVAKHLCYILEKENIKYDKEDLVPLITSNYPDIRSIIKIAQSCSQTGTFVYKEEENDFQEKILKLLKTPNKKTWYDIRQIIADEQPDDYLPLYKFLYDNVEEYSKGNDAELTIVIDEYLWRAGVVPDREINNAACFAKILEIINKK